MIDLSNIEPENLGPLHLEEIPLCSFNERGKPHKPKKTSKKKQQKEEKQKQREMEEGKGKEILAQEKQKKVSKFLIMICLLL